MPIEPVVMLFVWTPQQAGALLGIVGVVHAERCPRYTEKMITSQSFACMLTTLSSLDIMTKVGAYQKNLLNCLLTGPCLHQCLLQRGLCTHTL